MNFQLFSKKEKRLTSDLKSKNPGVVISLNNKDRVPTKSV